MFLILRTTSVISDMTCRARARVTKEKGRLRLSHTEVL